MLLFSKCREAKIEILIRAEGEDASYAVEKLVELIKNKFGEE
ncbi:MAG: HPr family phosphocarrier protein [Candidatus Njordarchaeia archaeon]